MLTEGEQILEDSQGVFKGTLEEILNQRCYLCNYKASHRTARDSLDLIVETWKGKPICLCCLTMKRMAYSIEPTKKK